METVKIVFAGRSGSGKTTLLDSYLDGIFLPDHIPTRGVEVRTKIQYVRHSMLKIHFVDTGDSLRYGSLIKPFFRKTDAFVIIYDATIHHVQSEVEETYRVTKRECPSAEVHVVANTKGYQVYFDGRDLCKCLGATYTEIDVSRGTGVNDLFDTLIESVRSKKLLTLPAERHYYDCCTRWFKKICRR